MERFVFESQPELNALLQVLSDDVLKSQSLIASGGSGARRSYVRAVLAFIEGSAFALKQMALKAGFAKDEPGLLRLLTERELVLKDDGSWREQRVRVRTVPNVLFALQLWRGKLMGTALTQQKKLDPKFFALAVKIRDRLTHPKDASKLEVTDGELKTVDEARDWFWTEVAIAALAAMVTFSKEFGRTDPIRVKRSVNAFLDAPLLGSMPADMREYIRNAFYSELGDPQ